MSDKDSLFAPEELETDWQKEWQDMPEFHQLKQEPYANINIRFRNKEDLEEFAKLVDQNLNNKTLYPQSSSQTEWSPPVMQMVEWPPKTLSELNRCAQVNDSLALWSPILTLGGTLIRPYAVST